MKVLLEKICIHSIVVIGIFASGLYAQSGPIIQSVDHDPDFGGMSQCANGSGFGSTQGTGTILLNGAPVAANSWSDTRVCTTIPSNAPLGPVTIQLTFGRGRPVSNIWTFNIAAFSPPVISFISPASGGAGSTVTIFGSNFGSAQNDSGVTFNGVTGTPSSWSDTMIVVPAPTNVHSGPVVVTTVSGPSNGVQFTFAPGIRFSLQSVYVTPDETNLEVDGSSDFSLVSSSGTPIADATWSIDNSSLATIAADSSTPSKATLQALAPGEVTVSATSSLGSAQAVVTIYATGTIPAGTPAWAFIRKRKTITLQGQLRPSVIVWLMLRSYTSRKARMTFPA